LYSLNANTGELIDSFGYKGRLWQGLGYVAPVISDDTLISATVSYSDNFFPSINAYNVLTGKLIWNCKLISKPPGLSLPFEYQIRGANPWSGMSLDSVNKILFVVTGNAQPEGNGIKRPGNNDYANSLVAINVKTGKIIWSFQEVSHDLWDKDISSPPILTTIVVGRKKIDVVIAPTKHGNTLILDRISGKPIFPWRLKKAPYSNIPGEHTAEYQPDVQSPEPFTKQIFSYDDITDIGKQNFDDIKNKIDKSNIGFFPPLEEGKEAIIFNVSGGANWPGASVDPSKGIMYTAASETTFRLSLMNKFRSRRTFFYFYTN
jgi:quinoprotein glucose dehydrogenase